MLTRDGFEIFPQVLSDRECAAVSGRVAEILSTAAGSRRLLDFAWCRELAHALRDHREIKARLPSNPVAVQCTFFDKSADKNWLVPLHQDLTIPVLEKIAAPQCTGWSEKEGVVFVQPPAELLASLVAVRIHLDDSCADNGPLRVVAESHQYGRLSTEQAAALRERFGETVCTASRGDALLMRPLLLHASSKAQSEAPRRVLHFLFGPAALPYGLEWHKAV
jgi:hypothetical protein